LKLIKGEIVPVEIEILPASILIRKGESLVLVIKGSEIIVEESVPGGTRGSAHAETVNQGTHAIYTGGQYGSHLLVPIILKLH
jgi:predicted acyl esterase